MPVVLLNGIKISLRMVGATEVLCYAENAISHYAKELLFRSGSSEYLIANPYYFRGNIPVEGTLWQCEGNIEEKKIFLDAKYFPYANSTVLYPFALFANNKKLGEYSGTYIPREKSLVVSIKDVDKYDCVGKCCQLKPCFGGKVIHLPPPEVISINNKLVKQICF